MSWTDHQFTMLVFHLSFLLPTIFKEPPKLPPILKVGKLPLDKFIRNLTIFPPCSGNLSIPASKSVSNCSYGLSVLLRLVLYFSKLLFPLPTISLNTRLAMFVSSSPIQEFGFRSIWSWEEYIESNTPLPP